MEKINLKLTTISKVILSPRDSGALYKDIDYSFLNYNQGQELSKEVNMIYPFYSYTNRALSTENNIENIKYYIPASSLKGAILTSLKEDDRKRILLFNDININPTDISLENLFKYQYLDSDTAKIKFEKFFENVGIETLQNGTSYDFYINLKENIDFESILTDLKSKTIEKLNNYMRKLNKVIKNITDNKTNVNYEFNLEISKELKQVIDNINSELNNINDDEYILFLGGFKGKINSLNGEINIDDIKSGFYLCDIGGKKYLPYGLVKLKIGN